jgi:hypothetical protein
MPMIAGTVSVSHTAPTFTASGAGLAKAIFDALRADFYDNAGTDDSKIALLESLAKISNTLASAIVTHITANALVTVNPLGLTVGAAPGPVVGTCTGTIT